ncbi:MAG: hypothetical protein KF709_13105 [Gemmatimonadaceae bacterium]|nr:hypothetical protein [Gemmatimonadaceae bacterium]
MTSTRRDFLDKLMVGGLSASGLALGLGALPDVLAAADLAGAPSARSRDWDVSWPQQLTGRVRSVFDVPEVERGYGVWRATIWAKQYEGVMGVPFAQLSTALVLRHNGIVLAMKQEFWDRYGVANPTIEHPLTGKVITKNPALLGEGDGVPEPYASFALPHFIARGGVVLACDAALRMLMVPLVVVKDGVSAEEARERAIAGLIPGVRLQPSGIFAALLAQQQAKALYIRAS